MLMLLEGAMNFCRYVQNHNHHGYLSMQLLSGDVRGASAEVFGEHPNFLLATGEIHNHAAEVVPFCHSNLVWFNPIYLCPLQTSIDPKTASWRYGSYGRLPPSFQVFKRRCCPRSY